MLVFGISSREFAAAVSPCKSDVTTDDEHQLLHQNTMPHTVPMLLMTKKINSQSPIAVKFLKTHFNINVIRTKNPGVNAGRCDHQKDAIDGTQMEQTDNNDTLPNQFKISIVCMFELNNIFIQTTVGCFSVRFVKHTSAFIA